MKRWIAVLAVVFCGGCQNPQDPVNQSLDKFERASTAIFSKVGKDSVVSSGQLNGSMGVKQPGYKVRGFAGLFNGVMFEGEIILIGVDGQMQGGINLGPRPETQAASGPIQ